MTLFIRRMRKLGRDPVGYLLDSTHAPLRALGARLYANETERFRELGQAASDRKISVIMTAFNTGHLIERAVKSVLAQSHANLELMVIDDASSDDTAAILAAMAAEDERLRVFSSPANHGTYWSKNWCLTKATGEFVAFHDSDDYSDPDRLRVQMGALLADPGLMACTCRWRRVDEADELQLIDGAAERMAAISLMIRRAPVLEKAGFFDTVRIAADTEYIRRLKEIFGWKGVRHLRQCLYTGLLRQGSLTTDAGSGFDWQRQGNSHSRAVGGNRAAYYHAFTNWHSQANAGSKDLMIQFPMAERPFAVPEALSRGCFDQDVTRVREITGVQATSLINELANNQIKTEG